MSDREALIDVIAARPREDTPRLALADWLDENGEPGRAAFVRLQCRASGLRRGTWACADALRAAEDCRAEHGVDWLGDWASRLVDWEYRRGFLWRVRITVDQFLAHGEELFRSEPVGRLELIDGRHLAFDGTPEPLGEDAVREVVAHPAFARVRDCAVVPARFLDTTPASAWLAALATNPQVTRLRRFGPVGDFSFNYDGYEGRRPRRGIDPRALAAFCGAAHLRRLRALNLSQCSVTGRDQDVLARQIATATFARSLRSLKLANCSLSPAALGHIATVPTFAKLRALDLHLNSRGPGEWQPLFQSTTFKALTQFALAGYNLPAYAGSALARQVRGLTVHSSGDREGDTEADRAAWFRLLSAAPPPLRLNLRCYDPGADVFAEIHRREWLRNVRALSISGDSQSEPYSEDKAGVCLLFRGNTMRRLTTLGLHEVGDDQVLAALANWPGLSRLDSLDLGDDYHGRLKPTGLLPAHPITCLRTVRGVTVSSDADAEHLLNLPGLDNLTSLQLSFLGHYDRGSHRYTDAVVLTEGAVDRLLRSERLSRVTDLTLGFGYTRRIESHVVPQFADPALMPRLQKLRLYVMRDGRSDDRLPIDDLRARFGLRLTAW